MDQGKRVGVGVGGDRVASWSGILTRTSSIAATTPRHWHRTGRCLHCETGAQFGDDQPAPTACSILPNAAPTWASPCLTTVVPASGRSNRRSTAPRIDLKTPRAFQGKRLAFIKRRALWSTGAGSGFRTQVFAQMFNAHGRAKLDEFTAAIGRIPETLERYLLMGTVDSFCAS